MEYFIPPIKNEDDLTIALNAMTKIEHKYDGQNYFIDGSEYRSIPNLPNCNDLTLSLGNDSGDDTTSASLVQRLSGVDASIDVEYKFTLTSAGKWEYLSVPRDFPENRFFHEKKELPESMANLLNNLYEKIQK